MHLTYREPWSLAHGFALGEGFPLVFHLFGVEE
jgi:hypothetical protein